MSEANARFRSHHPPTGESAPFVADQPLARCPGVVPCPVYAVATVNGNAPTSPALDVEAFQDEISALHGVRAARVVATPTGRVSEIHLVADGRKSAKQVVRDVQTVALAQFDAEIDYRIVSVVQFNGDPVPGVSPGTRARLRSISWTSRSTNTTCRVTVGFGDDEGTGESQGAATLHSRPRQAADAAIEALRDAAGASWPLDLVDAGFLEVGGRKVAVALLVGLRRGGEETLLGSALVRTDEMEAVVGAVLDAFNRALAPE